MDLISEITKTLTLGASAIVNDAKSTAQAKGIGHVGNALYIEPAVPGKDKVSITIVLSADLVPDAIAYEYGSGVHATRGPKGRYEIRPKDKNVLKFEFPESMNIFPAKDIPLGKSGEYAIGGAVYGKAPFLNYGDERGTVYLPYVLHPGVAPRPYINPSIDEHLPEITKEITDRVAATVILTIEGLLDELDYALQ